MADAFGDDRACGRLSRDDQDLRGGTSRPASELAGWAAEGVRGEVTVVVSGAVAGEPAGPADLVAEVEALVTGRGVRLKDATAAGRGRARRLKGGSCTTRARRPPPPTSLPPTSCGLRAPVLGVCAGRPHGPRPGD